MFYDGILIGINYMSSNETIEWAKSIVKNNSSSDLLIIVVDTSGDECDENLPLALKQIQNTIVYLNPHENLGYFGGARYGKKYVDEQELDFSFLIVSNVDLRFVSANISSEVHRFADETVGVISPSIISNGIDLNPYKIDRMTAKQMKRRLLYLKHPKLHGVIDFIRSIRKRKKQQQLFSPGTKMYMTYGACFIFTRVYFESGGDLNLPLFLYGEEPYIAEQCRKHNLCTVYAPSIKILDIGHVSTNKIPSKVHRDYLVTATYYCINNLYEE